MIVRRLTPMECERLQGFPDHWTDIGEWRDSKGKLRKPSDSPLMDVMWCVWLTPWMRNAQTIYRTLPRPPRDEGVRK